MAASARPQSPGPVRGRAAANRHQLQRFLQRAILGGLVRLNAGAGVERLGIEIFDRRVAGERLLVGSGQLTN